jgi:hypothetical protein
MALQNDKILILAIAQYENPSRFVFKQLALDIEHARLL